MRNAFFEGSFRYNTGKLPSHNILLICKVHFLFYFFDDDFSFFGQMV
ncbi:hypothetical protein QY95_03882 [Bacillus thermotolerans]|uniref:Uncharacterized protein n=1 Tax=Bacillus thermotolerans TaxID=1221996 RepID=A0A0F5HML7_BACTR|nr:hypothetical protein QY95_03882 [Bacillus thermotolerans]